MDKANPSFPRSAGVWWFGCSSRPRGRVTRSLNNFFNSTNCKCNENEDLVQKGAGQKSQGVGKISDRSDVPIRGFDTSPGKNFGDDEDEKSRGFGVSLWDLFAGPFRGLFKPD